MERTFDTNYILNDIYDNSDGTLRARRFDSNYIWNAIYDPSLPGIRIKDILDLLASTVNLDTTNFNNILNDTITDVQKLADFLDNLTISSSVYTDDTIKGDGTQENPLSILLTEINITLLSGSSWSGNTQTISVSGVTNTNEIFWDASTLSDNLLAGRANLFCSTQSTDSLTFVCSTTPTSDININVKIR